MGLLDPPTVNVVPKITGVSPALVDGVSLSSHPTILGTATPLSLISLYLNGALVASAFSDSDGNWAISLPAQLNGTVNLVARAAPASSLFPVIINDPKQPLQNAAGLPAVFDMDNEGGLYFTNGTPYADAASLIGALTNGVQNGSLFSCGGYLNPALKNIVTNGAFDIDVANWNVYNGASISWSAGEALVDTVGSGAVSQTIVGYPGRTFAFTAKSRRGTNTGNSPSIGGTLSNPQIGGNAVGLAAVTASDVVGTFYMSSLSGAAMYVGMRGNTGLGTAYMDDWSGIEAQPLPGWAGFATAPGSSAPAFSVVIDAISPASLPTSGNIKVLWQGDNNGTHDFIRIHWASDGTVHLYCLGNNASVVCDLNLGTLAVNTRFKVSVAAAQGFNGDATSGYAGSLNGKNSVGLFASNVSMLSPSHMRIGSNAAGASVWDGTYKRVSVVQGRQQNDWLEYQATPASSLASAVLFGGDSYIGGASGVVLPDLYETATGRTVYNIGVGGSTLLNQRDNTISRGYLRKLPFVHWDGSNNGMVDITSQVAIAQQIWDWKADGRILFLPSIAVPNPGVASSAVTNSNGTYLRQYRDALIDTFGAAHVYDPVPIIQTLSTGSADDLNDIASGVIPRSALITQNNAEVHLGLAAMTAIAQHSAFQAKVAAL